MGPKNDVDFFETVRKSVESPEQLKCRAMSANSHRDRVALLSLDQQA